MKTTGRRDLRRIAVLGNYGNLNLGDEATLASVLQFVRQRCPGAVVAALSERPEETRARHGIEAVPSSADSGGTLPVDDPAAPRRAPQARGGGLAGRLKAILKRAPLVFAILRTIVGIPSRVREVGRQLRFVARSFAFLRHVDLLVVAGGGQLSDHFEGVGGFPLQLFSWCLLARCAGAEAVVLNVGAGPIGHRGSRVLFRWTLRLARYRSYRDERSRRLIESIGVQNAGPVGPDLVFGWDPPAPRPEGPAPDGGTIGLNVFPYKDWRYSPVHDPAAYAAYVEKIADLTLWLLSQDYRVRLFPTQLRADRRVIRDVLETLKPRLPAAGEERLEVLPIRTVDNLAREIRRTDLIVATRFHAIAIAMLMGKPVLGLCNEPKMTDLMNDMEQGAYALALDSLEVPEAIARFVELWAQRERVTATLADRVERARRALEPQLDAVFGPAVGVTR